MAARSAGLLLYRRAPDLKVLLGHMGGPFWARRETGAWTIPKGEHADDEHPLAAARREFAEETGAPPPDGPFVELGSVRQKNGKIVSGWAVEGDFDVSALRSNSFTLEWPPRSGRLARFPELDRAAWFDLAAARGLIVAAQAEFLDRLPAALDRR